MANFKTQKELLKAIETNLDKLESGELDVAEMEQHLELVRELYERSVVLRYKAFERMTGTMQAEAPVVTVPQPEPTPSVPEPMPEPDEQPSIDFSLFDDEPEAEEEIRFEEPVAENSEPEPAPEPESESVAPAAAPEPTVNAFEQALVTPARSTDFEKRFSEVKGALTGQIGFEKLDTLVGSFGLNERLQYINELFDGSSDAFSDAIKQLDNMPDIDTAKGKAAHFAAVNAWDLESDTVEEFLQKLCRRYV